LSNFAFGKRGSSFDCANQSGLIETAIHPAPLARERRRENFGMRDGAKILANHPQIFLGRHPINAIKAAQIYGARKSAERLFTFRIVVMLEILHTTPSPCPFR
jgi:hypothetical protein